MRRCISLGRRPIRSRALNEVIHTLLLGLVRFEGVISGEEVLEGRCMLWHAYEILQKTKRRLGQFEAEIRTEANRRHRSPRGQRRGNTPLPSFLPSFLLSSTSLVASHSTWSAQSIAIQWPTMAKVKLLAIRNSTLKPVSLTVVRPLGGSIARIRFFRGSCLSLAA